MAKKTFSRRILLIIFFGDSSFVLDQREMSMEILDFLRQFRLRRQNKIAGKERSSGKVVSHHSESHNNDDER